MDSTRITAAQEDGARRITIRPYNNLLGILLLVFALSFVAAAVIGFFMAAGTFFNTFRIRVDMLPLGKLMLAVYALVCFFILARYFLWLAWGVEEIAVSAETFYYSRTFLGRGKKYILNTAEIKAVKFVNYIDPKDIFEVLLSESGFFENSFLVETEKERLRFGICLDMEEVNFVQAYFNWNNKNNREDYLG
jgi:energy-coupling factor transporter transmembrane protein EcfT